MGMESLGQEVSFKIFNPGQKYSFKNIQSRKKDKLWLRCNMKQYEASPLIKVNETNLEMVSKLLKSEKYIK